MFILLHKRPYRDFEERHPDVENASTSFSDKQDAISLSICTVDKSLASLGMILQTIKTL